MRQLGILQAVRYKIIVAAIAVFVFCGLPTPVSAASDLIFNRPGTPTRYGDWATNVPVENLSLDINGDSLRDLVRIYRNEAGRAMADILFTNGKTFYRDSGSSVDLGSWEDGTVPVKYVVIDADGNGREDIARIWRSATGRMMLKPIFSSGATLFHLPRPPQDIGPWAVNGRSVQIVPMRVRADAQTDLVLIERSATGKAIARIMHGFGYGEFINCTAAICQAPLDIGDWAINDVDVKRLGLDVDGDKQEDLVQIGNVGGQVLVDILHSYGNGFHRLPNHAAQMLGPWSGNGMINQHVPMDIDRDGRVDLLRITKNISTTAILRAEGLYSDGRSFNPVPGGSSGYAVAENTWALNATKPPYGRPTLFRLIKTDNHFLATMDYVDKLAYNTFKDRLTPGQRLESGHYLNSPNYNYRLTLRKDGNLVLADVAERIVWQSNTAGSGAQFLAMQSDGNAALYNATGPVWATNTYDYPIEALVVRDDGQYALQKADGTPLWLSRDHAPQPKARITTTVMAYNIADHVTDGHANLVAQTIINKGRPDIVLLNEVRHEHFRRSQSDVIADRAGYKYRYYHHTTMAGIFKSSKGVAMLSHYPLEDRKYWDVPKPAVCGFPLNLLCPHNFGIIKATITIRGVPHDVYSLRFAPQHPRDHDAYHWSEIPSNQLGHKLATDLVKATPANRAIIMGGDFNAEWKSSPWTRTFRDQSGLRDAFVDFDRHNYPQTHSYDGRVDYIYYRGGPYVLKNAEMGCGLPDCGPGDDENYASDHRYVYAVLAQPGT